MRKALGKTSHSRANIPFDVGSLGRAWLRPPSAPIADICGAANFTPFNVVE